MPPLISTLVLNYRTPLDAVTCVKNLQKQTISDQMEIIVIDNHSDDDSIGILRNRLGDFKNVKIVETWANLGFGKGNNIGEPYAKGEFILILNPDTEPEPNALEKLISVLRSDESIGIIAPKLEFPDGTARDSYRTFPTIPDLIIKRTFLRRFFKERLKHYLQHEKDPFYTRDTDWVVGAFMLMKRSLFEELGGFDPRFFLFFEDTDLCRRCWKAGKRVLFYPQVSASDHKHRLSGSGVLPLIKTKSGRAHVVSAVRYFGKWSGKSSL
ncbi:glycosyltransferase family 2 protein [Patescibacteria group bacterium]|nr:glycosyltransferase family 2 protein [Patescibacteria group bacterium]MBU1123156.1 glycosyltransferase family 2 protein [Patescibacteria group bacterium]